MTSDGCTGFWWAEHIWPIHQCCVIHDFGGSDGGLLDCLHNVGVPIVPALIGLLVMASLRPVYHLIKYVLRKK